MRARTAWIIAALLAFQALVLVGTAAAEEWGARGGTEVRLQTVPVDPRDLLRGDYVALGYAIGSPAGGAGFEVGDTVYVRLVPRGDVWVDAGLSRQRPPAGGDLAIRGTVTAESPLRATYGIEAYFVPEGRGREITQAADVDAVVSIDGAGKARLRYLIVDGERWDG